MEQPTIRLATIEDLPWIRALWRDFVTEFAPPYPRDVLGSIDTFTRQCAMALTEPQPTTFCFLAADGDDPIGFLLYEIQQRAFGEPARLGFLAYVYVAPAYRARGLGVALLSLCGEHATAQGLVDCEMAVRPGDTQWDWCGFEPFEVRHHAPVALVVERLAAATARGAARHGGNGLDPAPPPLEPAED
jgi:GNAT superfamily N-acetyltransferase